MTIYHEGGERRRALDIHAHHVGRHVVERIELGGRTTGMPLIPPLVDERARLKWMDESRIDVQLLSGWMDLAGYHLPQEAGSWLARLQNDALADIVKGRPDRYVAAAMVPLQSPAAARPRRPSHAARRSSISTATPTISITTRCCTTTLRCAISSRG